MLVVAGYTDGEITLAKLALSCRKLHLGVKISQQMNSMTVCPSEVNDVVPVFARKSPG